MELYGDYVALGAARSLLSWDQQVLMPPGGAAARAAHLGVLTSRGHAILTSDGLRRMLESAERETDPDSDEAAMLRVLRRDVDHETKLPAELVDRKVRIGSEAYQIWKTAKPANDYGALESHFQQLFDLAKETADHLGYKQHPYDALIDQFEEGATYASARAMFDEIRRPIIELVREIRDKGRKVDDGKLRGGWDSAALRDFTEAAATEIGYDFRRGRLDIAPNAFCSTFDRGDVRMTTRPSDHIKGVVSSSFHEMGHGLYEQGSPAKWETTPLSGGISLAVHESQSRMWENIIGRSRGFWSYFLPKLRTRLGGRPDCDLDEFYRAINIVRPEFVRVGADELTYNLHILVRFELEVEIVTGKVTAKDLPDAWNAKYADYLGITPPTDTVGVLQDVHWTRGSIGYFPTYAMGNLIGAQIWEALLKDIPEPQGLMARGEFRPILEWLQTRIYALASRYPPSELITRVTGEPMTAKPWLRYANEKYRAIYEL